MALEESSMLKAELCQHGGPAGSWMSDRKNRKGKAEPTAEPEEECEEFFRIKAKVEGLTRSGHQALVLSNVREALSCLKKAFSLAMETPSVQAQKVCALNLGAAYMEAGKLEKGLGFLLQAQPTEGEAAEHLGDLFFNIGVAHEALQDFPKALEFFRKAQGNYHSIQASSKASTYMKMGRCYLGMDNPSRAAQCFLQAGRTCARVESLEAAAAALSEAGSRMLQSQQHGASEIVMVLDECRLMCEQIPHRAFLGKLYSDMGLIFSQLKIFSLAAISFERALLLGQTGAEDQRKAAILQNLGATHNALGDLSKAMGFHRKAASLHGTLGNRRAQGQCFSNLAYAFSQLGDHEAAVENYLHALQAFKDSDYLQGQWRACEGLGTSHAHLGDAGKAIFYYKEALTLTSKCQDISDMAPERIVNELTDALQCKLSMNSHSFHGDGVMPSTPKHFPTSQAPSQVALAMPLHGKKENFPPAVCHISKSSVVPRCHQEQPLEQPCAPAPLNQGALLWGELAGVQTSQPQPQQAGPAAPAAAPLTTHANGISAPGIPSGHAALITQDPTPPTEISDSHKQKQPGSAAAPEGYFSGQRLKPHQQGWRNRLKSIICALM